MQPIRFERDVLEQTDEELGRTLAAYWLSIAASGLCVEGPEIPVEFALGVMAKAAKNDGESVKFAALESIFRKACSGNYAAAGRMFREYVQSNEKQWELEKQALNGNKVSEGRKRGGEKSAKQRKADASDWQDRCRSMARNMLAERTAPRELVGKLAVKFGKSPRQVRNVLKKEEMK